jgi:hypothetical protein
MSDKPRRPHDNDRFEEKKSTKAKDGFHAYFENEESSEEFIKPHILAAEPKSQAMQP